MPPPHQPTGAAVSVGGFNESKANAHEPITTTIKYTNNTKLERERESESLHSPLLTFATPRKTLA
jgi:hypothetical protein